MSDSPTLGWITYASNEAHVKETPILLAAILGAGLMFIRPAEALAQIVDTESSGVGRNVSADQVRDLPLNSRNFETLINLTPGVLTDQLPVQPSGQASMGSSQWMIDGVVITDPLPPGSDPTRVNLDAIEEIKVQTGGFEAEYGRATGGVINVVTKTGSNEFRAGTGEPFDFVLNEGTGGTCLSEIQGLPGGDTVRGSIQFCSAPVAGDPAARLATLRFVSQTAVCPRRSVL
jgi:outer membrane receptor protein involved in Fe transport